MGMVTEGRNVCFTNKPKVGERDHNCFVAKTREFDGRRERVNVDYGDTNVDVVRSGGWWRDCASSSGTSEVVCRKMIEGTIDVTDNGCRCTMSGDCSDGVNILPSRIASVVPSTSDSQF